MSDSKTIFTSETTSDSSKISNTELYKHKGMQSALLSSKETKIKLKRIPGI